MDWIIIVALLALSALFSGLNLGLMSLGPSDLKRKIRHGDERAKKIYAVRKNGNQLLVTLLLGNVAVNSILAIFLSSLTVGVVAVIASTGLITLFGEIIPQAVLSRYALDIGSKTAWIVRIFIFILYPVCKPIAWSLDKVLGHEMPTLYLKKELVSMLEEHSNDSASDVQAHEERIARGALTYGDKKVHDVMTPRSVVMLLDIAAPLSDKLLNALQEDGHERFPVYKGTPENIVGILHVRDLLVRRDGTVASVARKPVHFIHEMETLDKALTAFITTKNHLFVVVNSFEEIVGVVSLEDIIEEIIGTEIVDEFDKYTDMRAAALGRNNHKSENS